MVTIATFNESTQARQLKRRFQDSGIRADVHNEAPMQQFGFMPEIPSPPRPTPPIPVPPPEPLPPNPSPAPP